MDGDTIQHKVEQHLQSMINFMEQLRTLFHEFGIETFDIWSYLDYADKMAIGLPISESEENLIRYMDIIGYRYATTKSSESYCITEYLRYKHIKIEERVQLKETSP